MSGKRPADSPPDGEPNEKKVMSQMSSSLPQVRLGTIGSEEELNTKIEEFATKRLKELLDSETKLRKEAEERAQTAQNKLTENKGKDRKINHNQGASGHCPQILISGRKYPKSSQTLKNIRKSVLPNCPKMVA